MEREGHEEREERKKERKKESDFCDEGIRNFVEERHGREGVWYRHALNRAMWCHIRRGRLLGGATGRK